MFPHKNFLARVLGNAPSLMVLETITRLASTRLVPGLGVEPRLQSPKLCVLPLYYPELVGIWGIEPQPPG